MGVKFNVTYNTPSDWVKAIVGGVVAVGAVLTAVKPDGITSLEWVEVITSAVVTFGTILGFYHGSAETVAPDNTEPVNNTTPAPIDVPTVEVIDGDGQPSQG
jgi:hypothetical protein